MRHLIRCLLLTFLTLPSLAQSIVLRGRVLDAETGQPIPNAPVGVARHRIGTTTNLEGRFALQVPATYQASELDVSMLGYVPYRQKLPPLPGPELTLRLRPQPAALGEVQVSGSVLGIVREAVARIPRNYPGQPTRLEGFFRESDNSLATGNYEQLGEAVLSVYKAPYTEPHDNGDVVVEQSRRLELAGVKKLLQPHWMAGPFVAHRFDFVHKRLEFIDEKAFRHYAYKIDDLTTFDGRPVYIIGFGPKPGNRSADFAGQLFIDQQTYAFLAAEWHRTPAGLVHEEILSPGLDAQERSYRVDYQPYAGRWHLRRVWYHTTGTALASGKPFRHLAEFLTTAIDTARHPRPSYVERAQFRDVFQDNTLAYDTAYWRNYTTLVPPEQLRQALRDQERQQRAEELFAAGTLPPGAPLDTKALLAAADSLGQSGGAAAGKMKALRTAMQLLRRFHVEASWGVLPMQATATEVQVAFAPPGSSFHLQAQATAPAQRLISGYGSRYAFDLAKHLALDYTSRRLLYNFRGERNELGLTYERNLLPRHRPLYLRVGAAYTWQRLRYGVGTFANADTDLRVAGTTLAADEVGVAVQQRLTAWQPRLGLALELSRRFRLVADVGYLLARDTRIELFLEEKSGFFLFRNDVSTSLPLAGAAVSVAGSTTPALPWQQNRLAGTLMLVYRAL